MTGIFFLGSLSPWSVRAPFARCTTSDLGSSCAIFGALAKELLNGALLLEARSWADLEKLRGDCEISFFPDMTSIIIYMCVYK